mmetsp:Transcript_66402/g.205958  ORF Transcript_66402/g.205958 Transcript_66402/m.205958 type:complete len:241 (-) Transcript_66402:443-1165(-)
MQERVGWSSRGPPRASKPMTSSSAVSAWRPSPARASRGMTPPSAQRLMMSASSSCHGSSRIGCTWAARLASAPGGRRRTSVTVLFFFKIFWHATSTCGSAPLMSTRWSPWQRPSCGASSPTRTLVFQWTVSVAKLTPNLCSLYARHRVSWNSPSQASVTVGPVSASNVRSSCCPAASYSAKWGMSKQLPRFGRVPSGAGSFVACGRWKSSTTDMAWARISKHALRLRGLVQLMDTSSSQR